jgi:replicative DNA helicase
MLLQSTGSNLLAIILRDSRLQSFLKLDQTTFVGHEAEIYGFVDSYYKKYGKLPSMDLACKKTDLEKVDDTDVYGYYYDEYVGRIIYNKLADALPQIQALVSNKKTNEALEKIKEVYTESESVKKDDAEDLVNLVDLGDVVLDHITDARAKEGLTGIPSGWKSLDDTTGGFQRGEMYIMAARPKVGKSMLLMLMADYAHTQGFIPLWVSMEMRLQQVARRHYAKRAKISMKHVKSGMISSFSEIRIKEIKEELSRQQPFYYVQGQFKKNINEISSLAHGLKPDIVFIDGGYLVKLLRSDFRAKWEYTAEIAQTIKELAESLIIPVVVTFQFNRDFTKSRTKGVEHLQLSDALGQLASLVIGILEENPNRSHDIIVDPIRHLTALAGREGETFGFDVNWKWDIMDFSERIENESIM